MSINKNFTKSGNKCRVTFKLMPETVLRLGAENVVLVGDFCDWKVEAGSEMRLLKNGAFSTTITLETGRDYLFKYVINGSVWENDDQPDAWVNDQSGNSNSMISLKQ
ncbi:MAG: isoamylase early set domain-containing protein [bacterium]|nr:isoamylase early set domain-containing protein [bacterium]